VPDQEKRGRRYLTLETFCQMGGVVRTGTVILYAEDEDIRKTTERGKKWGKNSVLRLGTGGREGPW